MKAEKLTYNLTGQGLLTTWIYPHTKALYQFLKSYHYDAKWHFTNQLGALRNFLHGAHHTRYEYIILQWVLINHLKEKVKGVGLSRNRDVFGSLPGIDKNPSGAEILQCLTILTNMGHFPDTFAASRAWLHLLKTNQGKVRTAFRTGLYDDDKNILDKLVKNFDIYHIHLVNALFLLERYRRAEQGNDFVDFSRKILVSYITREDKELLKLWEIYGQIRQLSYLILDSHYAPIPFVLDLSSILLNFDQVFDQILNRNSEFQKGVRQLDRVLQDTLYMTGNSLITTSARTEEILENFSSLGKSVNWKKISVVRDLLEPLTAEANDDISAVFQKCSSIDFPIPDWDSTKILEQRYPLTRRYRDVFPNDVVEWETCTRKRIGINSCRIAAQYYPVVSTFKIVFALNKKLSSERCLIKSIECAKEAMEFDYQIKKEGYRNKSQYENDEKILLFLLKSTFGWTTNYKLEFPDWKGNGQNGVDSCPLFVGKGAVSIAKRLEKYIEHMKDEFNSDQLHEYSLVERVLRNIGHRGLVLAFAGSTKIRLPDQDTEDAEFDGIIFLPGMKGEVFFIVIEAKNRAHGQTAAKGQLRRRLGKLLPSYLSYDLVDLSTDGAYAMIKICSCD